MDWASYWSRRAPFDRAIAELKSGDGSSLPVVERFLAERPRFLQSGYIAERMLRYVSRAQLSAAERERIVALATRIADEGRTREAREAKLLLLRLK